MKVYRYQIISALVLLLCVDVTYLNEIFHRLPTIQYYGRCVVLLYMLLDCVRYRRHLSKILKCIFVFVLWVLGITYIRGGELIEALKVFSSPLLLCVYIEKKRNSTQLYGYLDTWKSVLLVFVCIDFFTQILFPHGMYRDTMYSLNWFLGYKTARLAFSLPLCVLSSIVDMHNRKRLTWRTWICYALSVETLCINRRGKFTERVWEKLLNLKFVLAIYAVISVLVVYVQNSPQIQYILVNIMHKDPTLTTRTYIWNLCIESLAKQPLTGLGYLNSLSYQNLTNNMYATSAHNMSLSILISGGFIGLAIYVIIIIVAWQSFKINISIEKKITSIAIIAILIIGMTSSSMVFSSCAFIFYELMAILDMPPLRKNFNIKSGED